MIKLSFCQNNSLIGKRTAWSLIYFLIYAYLEIRPSVLFFYSPSNNSFWKNFTLCYLTIIIRFEILKAFIFFNCRYNFFCDTCGKQFCRPFELRRHMAVKHGEGEMPYPCDQCEKKFFEPKELRSHIAITHQGELIRNTIGSNKAFFFKFWFDRYKKYVLISHCYFTKLNL